MKNSPNQTDTVPADRERTLASRVAEIKRQIEDWNHTREVLERSLEASKRPIAELEKKRREVLPAARSGQDKVAQEKLRQTSTDLEKGQKDQGDDQEALAVVKQKLETLKFDLAVAEKQRQREHLRALIRARLETLNPERQALKSMTELFQALTEAATCNSELAVEMKNFDERLRGRAERLWDPHVYGVDLDVDAFTRRRWSEAFEGLIQRAKRVLSSILEALDALPLEGEKTPPGFKKYEVSGGIVGLKGLSVVPGERISLRPDDENIVSLVGDGMLREVLEESPEEPH